MLQVLQTSILQELQLHADSASSELIKVAEEKTKLLKEYIKAFQEKSAVEKKFEIILKEMSEVEGKVEK